MHNVIINGGDALADAHDRVRLICCRLKAVRKKSAEPAHDIPWLWMRTRTDGDVPEFWPSAASAKTTAAKTADTASPGLRGHPSGSRDIFDFVALSRVIRRPPLPRRHHRVRQRALIYYYYYRNGCTRVVCFDQYYRYTTRNNYIAQSATGDYNILYFFFRTR